MAEAAKSSSWLVMVIVSLDLRLRLGERPSELYDASPMTESDSESDVDAALSLRAFRRSDTAVS